MSSPNISVGLITCDQALQSALNQQTSFPIEIPVVSIPLLHLVWICKKSTDRTCQQLFMAMQQGIRHRGDGANLHE